MVAEILPPPSWFDLRNYAATNRLDFTGWRIQISNRIYLETLLKTESYDTFDQYFSYIQTNPIRDFNYFDVHISNKAVFPLPYRIAESMVRSLAQYSPQPKESCDQKLLDIGAESFGIHGHVVVDLIASETELIEAFKEWLKSPQVEAAREKLHRVKNTGISDTVAASWRKHKLLAFQDLSLWYRRQDQAMPPNPNVAIWIYTDQHGDESTVRTAKKLAANTFTSNSIRQLSLAISQKSNL